MYKKLLLLFSWSTLLYAPVDLVITPEPLGKSIDRAVNVNVNTHLGAGFFCEFLKVIGAIIYYESEKFASIKVDWTYEFFPFKDSPTGNGWDLYFEPIAVKPLPNDEPIYPALYNYVHELHDQICISPWLSYEGFFPYRSFAHQKIKEYIHVKKEVTDKVDAFYNQHMEGYKCIGVHVRFAAAHAGEVPGGHPPTVEDYFREVDAIKQAHPAQPIRIYIASDSHHVVNEFKQHYGSEVIHIDAYRAHYDDDPGLIYTNSEYWLSHPQEWHQKKPGYYGGLTALMDCLLLARCSYLIHTTSNVSTSVTFFNPWITSVYLPRNIPNIPCRYKGSSKVRNPFLNPV